MGDNVDIRLGDYRLVDRIGAGGMGQVYRARHELMGKTYAVEVGNAAHIGPVCGMFRVLRGGPSLCPGTRCRSAYRLSDRPALRSYGNGLRVVVGTRGNAAR